MRLSDCFVPRNGSRLSQCRAIQIYCLPYIGNLQIIDLKPQFIPWNYSR
jgi:hypothetical protein